MSKRLKIAFVFLFYFVMIGLGLSLFTPAFVSSFNPDFIFRIWGIFFILYAVIGVAFKMPVFNRHYVYKGSGFDCLIRRN